MNSKVACPPITFQLPGQRPDTRLGAFHQEFRVHSVVLKLYSAYFRQFLDSPEKTPSTQDGYRYNWTTKVDEEGWHLVSTDEYAKPDETDWYEDPTEVDVHIACFTSMLSAMYNRPYRIRDTDNLLMLVKLGDYYCCLPIISRTLDSAMLASDKFPWYAELRVEGFTCLNSALKLRNAALMRDLIVLVAGNWHVPYDHYSIEVHRDLINLIQTVKSRIGAQFAKAFKAGLDQITREEGMNQRSITGPKFTALHFAASLASKEALEFEHPDGSGDRPPVELPYLPQYLRTLKEESRRKPDRIPSDFGLCIDELLKCNLQFPVEGIEAGVGKFESFFLCGEVLEHEIPWDVTETDW